MKKYIIYILNIIFLLELFIFPNTFISFINFIYINVDYYIKNYFSFVFLLFYYYYLIEISFYNICNKVKMIEVL